MRMNRYSIWTGLVLASGIAVGSATAATTVRFDLPEIGLGIFGLQYTSDYGTPVEDVRDMRIIETRMHLEFDTAHDFGNLADAATIAVELQAPIVNIDRVLSVSGDDLNWSGTGLFTGDASSAYLNDDLLDFSDLPDGSLVLWFMRIVNLDDQQPQLGGHFANSYIEVDFAPVPEPSTLALLALVGFWRRR